MIVSDAIGEKALRLVEDRRVHLVERSESTYQFGDAMVSGDTGFHKIYARPDHVLCDCPAWNPDRYCSHAVAAMLLWGDDGCC